MEKSMKKCPGYAYKSLTPLRACIISAMPERGQIEEVDIMESLRSGSITQLTENIQGTIVLPGDRYYDKVRKIWNAMIDKRPAVIVQCRGAGDVVKALTFGRENEMDISIRGAGHNIAGNSLCDNGLMIDLSTMKNIRVDADRRRAFVEPGATLGDFDKAAQAHGLATPVGINSTTGIAGLTLGGGFGWLTRKYGMTIDNLVAAEMVTVDGKRLHVSADENADLFWAIRGGGGNFGIVTEFEFALHPVGPEILAGLIVYPLEQARQVLTRYREFVATAPEELTVWSVLRAAPPLPFLPQEVHGKNVVVLAFFYGGDIEEGRKLIEPMRGFGDPYGEHFGAQPYVDWQQAFDPLLTPGARNYWKSHNLKELQNGLLDTIIKYAATLPTLQCEFFIGHIGGAANRIAPDAMAWGHRDAQFVLNVHARWDEAGDDSRCIAWAREFFTASAPYASSGAYVNFMTAEEGSRVAAAYGANFSRLRKMKRRYDPKNILHLNQNINPE
jgi:FAD/FMN-containing dehydrogenase